MFNTVNGGAPTAWQRVQQLTVDENRLALSWQNNLNQQQFLQAEIEGVGQQRGMYPRTENTSKYLADLLGEESEPMVKADILARELAHVHKAGMEMEGQLAKIRKELAEAQKESEKFSASNRYASPPQTDPKVLALLKRKTSLSREKPPIEREIQVAQGRLGVLDAALRRANGERIGIESEYLDQLLWGALTDGMKIARITAETAKVKSKLAEAQKRLAASDDELQAVIAEARELVREEMTRRRQRMDERLLEIEADSLWLDNLATQLFPGRPEMCGCSYFAEAIGGSSAFRHERLDRLNRAGITAARRAS